MSCAMSKEISVSAVSTGRTRSQPNDSARPTPTAASAIVNVVSSRPPPRMPPPYAAGQLEQRDPGDGGKCLGRLGEGQRVTAPRRQRLEPPVERRGEGRTEVDQGGHQQQPSADAPDEHRPFPPFC